MRKVRIGTREFDDTLAGLTSDAFSQAAERMGTLPRGQLPGDSRPYSPNKPVAIEVRQPTGEYRRLVIRPVDLTPLGLGGLVGLFLHPGLECTVHLVTHDGEHTTVNGKTDQCVFLCNKVHYFGICFDDPINTRHFLLDELGVPHAEESISPVARLIEQIGGQPGHALCDDLVTILRSEADRLSGEPSILSAHELVTPIRVAVIDHSGDILAVNPSWLLFAAESGYRGAAFSSINYLDTLAPRVERCVSVRPVHDAFIACTRRESAEFRYAYECHGRRGEMNYYLVRHTADERLGQPVVIVSHILIDRDAIDAVREAG